MRGGDVVDMEKCSNTLMILPIALEDLDMMHYDWSTGARSAGNNHHWMKVKFIPSHTTKRRRNADIKGKPKSR